MVMLSQLLRCNLFDSQGGHAKLIDLSVDVLDGDYPPVTGFYFLDSRKEKRFVAAASVQEIDRRRCRIKVSSLREGVPEASDSIAQKVLLKVNILDALILDLQNRRATRAN